MRAILKPGILIPAALVVLWLLNDALTFTLYARSAERGFGCYTAIELWLGAAQPGWIRQAELISGLGLILTALGFGVRATVRGERTRAAVQWHQ
jgi:hypothetical protein